MDPVARLTSAGYKQGDALLALELESGNYHAALSRLNSVAIAQNCNGNPANSQSALTNELERQVEEYRQKLIREEQERLQRERLASEREAAWKQEWARSQERMALERKEADERYERERRYREEREKKEKEFRDRMEFEAQSRKGKSPFTSPRESMADVTPSQGTSTSIKSNHLELRTDNTARPSLPSYEAAISGSEPPSYEVSNRANEHERHLYTGPYNDIVKAPAYTEQAKLTVQSSKASSIPHGVTNCSYCFDKLNDHSLGFSGEVVVDQKMAYHRECYLRKTAPKCAYCCDALVQDSDRGYSGRWGYYESKPYHQECFEKYAGPRCIECLDVIVRDVAKGFSGAWRGTKNEQLHEECYEVRIARAREVADT
eukprot:Colp12_sorted_trinity150504_noHs@30312